MGSFKGIEKGSFKGIYEDSTRGLGGSLDLVIG